VRTGIWVAFFALLAGLLTWGIFAYAQHENNAERECHRNNDAHRVYLKTGSDGLGAGHYCVYVYYKE
jgi:hypothetical protein